MSQVPRRCQSSAAEQGMGADYPRIAPEDGPLVVTRNDKVIIVDTLVPASQLPSPDDPTLCPPQQPRIVSTIKNTGVKMSRKSSSESTSSSFLKFFGRRRSNGSEAREHLWVMNQSHDVVTVVVSMLGPYQKSAGDSAPVSSGIGMMDLDYEV